VIEYAYSIAMEGSACGRSSFVSLRGVINKSFGFCGGADQSTRRPHKMAGTKKGGQAAATTNKTKYGSDFYSRIGSAGGKKGHTGGFYSNRELARIAGAKGGRISRRTKKAA